MIYLVRQGQTDWNLFHKFNGVTDTFLNQTGIAQVKLQAENLGNVNFDACFCSPQTRARQTCEIIYKGPIVFDDRLVEINCGEFEGTEETVDAMNMFWQAAQTGTMGTESAEEFWSVMLDALAKCYLEPNNFLSVCLNVTYNTKYYFVTLPST